MVVEAVALSLAACFPAANVLVAVVVSLAEGAIPTAARLTDGMRDPRLVNTD